MSSVYGVMHGSTADVSDKAKMAILKNREKIKAGSVQPR
jgi:hypothetical protein